MGVVDYSLPERVRPARDFGAPASVLPYEPVEARRARLADEAFLEGLEILRVLPSSPSDEELAMARVCLSFGELFRPESYGSPVRTECRRVAGERGLRWP